MGFWGALLGVRQIAEVDEAPPEMEARGKTPWKCGILYRTSMPVQEIETWLDSHATERWSVALEEMDASLKGKVLRIMFASHADKAAFTRDFTRR